METRSPEVPPPGRGNDEAAERGVALLTGGYHAIPRSARPSPPTRIMWRHDADHERKHEPGGETVTWGIDTHRPITEALSVIR